MLTDRGYLYDEFDQVTGLWNRNMFELTLMELREENNLLIVSFDLNNLKYVNDNFGHTYGDEYLKSAADKLKALMPKDGKVFRIGGDEFSFVLKYSIENKKKIEELINERLDILSDVEFDIPGNKDVCLKVAYGYSFRNENESLKDLIDRADNKMYDMKKRMKQI